MKQGPIIHRTAQVGAPAATRTQLNICHRNQTLGVVSDLIIHQEIMPFTCDAHVIVPVQAKLDGHACQMGPKSCQHREVSRLTLLSTERPAHSTNLDSHSRRVDVE